MCVSARFNDAPVTRSAAPSGRSANRAGSEFENRLLGPANHYVPVFLFHLPELLLNSWRPGVLSARICLPTLREPRRVGHPHLGRTMMKEERVGHPPLLTRGFPFSQHGLAKGENPASTFGDLYK